MHSYVPMVELTRGPLVESIHFGAAAVVDPTGRLLYAAGNPDLVANLRSSAKPFQILSLVEAGGLEALGLDERELAIGCSSHSGTDSHASVLGAMQAKIGVTEADLRCGVHYPLYDAAARQMRQRGELPTPNRHNCSGKHTAMLANARVHGFAIEDYLNLSHPLQLLILQTFAEMVSLDAAEVPVGIDGCSAPTFAAPLRQAALAYARLADPRGLPQVRAAALGRIRAAMAAHPDMVAGPERWDTLVMQATHGKVVSKGGAEGYQGMAVLPGALGPDSPGLGITLKIADGDAGGRAVHTAALEILLQLGVLAADEQAALRAFGRRALFNWREIEIGEIRPAFRLERLA